MLVMNITALTSAPGGQDHTTSPSATIALVIAQQSRPPHPALNVRDDAYVPLSSGDARR
jgi:hypothetical protein